MSQDTESFPIEDCEDCVHSPVCKFIEEFKNIAETGSLPIDFDSVSCLAYISEEVLSDYLENAENEEDTLYWDATSCRSIKEVLEKVLAELHEHGCKATKALMSSDTMKIYSHNSVLKSVDTAFGNIKLAIDESIEFGVIHLPSEEVL